MADEPETTDAPDEAVEQVADAAPTGTAESAAPQHDSRTPKERRSDRRAAAVAKRGARRGATPEEREAERRRKAAQRSRYRANLKARRAANPREATPQLTKDETTGAQKVRLGIVAPKEVPVHRQEVFDAIHGKEPSSESAPAPVVVSNKPADSGAH